MNILNKIYRFFVPKGGFKANMEKGKAAGKEIGMQAGEEINKTLDKINTNKIKDE